MSSGIPPKSAAGHPLSAPTGSYRWTVCALVFFATTINYLDRSVISLLKGDLEQQFHWTESDYSHITMAFQFAYAVGLLFAGKFIDRIGTRLGYALSILAWSLSAMGHALVRSTFGFGIARASLGITEAGNFPSAIKTIAEWFPQKERALATGIFNSGTNIGAIVAPLTVPFIAVTWGWGWAFIITGALGFIWLIAWLWIYEIPSRQKKLSEKEFEYIHSDPVPVETRKEGSGVSWSRLLSYRQTWAYVFGKFLTDPIWWFYLFWLPAFLKEEYKLVGTKVALPIALIYTLSATGSIFGGWLPLYLVKKGRTIFQARRQAMFFYALCALPVLFAQKLGAYSYWFPVAIIGLATAGHQAWSANIYTTASDMFPKKAVASVTGIGGMAGALGGLLIAWAAGLLFDHYKALGHLGTGYFIMFLVCGSAYLLAWTLMQLLAPKMRRVDL